MRADLDTSDRHAAGYRWAQRLEEETGIHNLVGLHWDVWPSFDQTGEPSVRGCDTAWMLAHVCPRTWAAARKMVLSAIAGRPHRKDVRLTSPVNEHEQDAAIAALRRVGL